MKSIIDNRIYMIKENHQYVLETQPDLKFKSVTTILNSFFEPFDENAVATNLCNTHRNYIGMNPDQLISKWQSARDHGTQVHDEIDLLLKEDIKPTEAKATTAFNWLDKYCMKSNIEILSEVIVYSTDLQIAGTVDILAYDKIDDVYEIIDWKTSKKIKTTSFQNKMGTHPITSNIMDCNFNHYSLQLSFYRFLLEKYYGIRVRNQMIAQLQNKKCMSYVTPYYNEQISAMIAEIN